MAAHQQLHLSANPDESLNQHFIRSLSVSMHGGNPTPPSLPYAQRKLPASFFRPPSASSSAAHSRESSVDASFSPRPHLASPSGKPPTPSANVAAASSPLSSSPASPPTHLAKLPPLQHQVVTGQATTSQQQSPLLPPVATVKPPPPPTSGLVIHSRTRSLPVSLSPNAFSLPTEANQNVPPNNQLQQQHQQQQHLLPQSRKSQSPVVKAIQNAHFRQHSYDLNKLPFPEGWSMSFTENGDRYFLNHKEKITTWEDPRKEMLRRELQNANANSLAQVAQRQLSNPTRAIPGASMSFSSQPNMQQVMQQQQQFADSRLDLTGVPLPDGWKQTTTPNGDVYYVNLKEQSTSWFHPSIGRQVQLKTVQLKQASSGLQPPSFLFTLNQQVNNANGGNIPPELLAALENMTTESNSNGTGAQTVVAVNPNSLLQQLQLAQQQATLASQNVRDLELERERMRQRQEEILQSSQLKTNYTRNPFNGTAEDPFLSSSANGTGTGHSLQGSLDSGLSLSAGSTSLGNAGNLTLNSFAIASNGFGNEQPLNGHANGHANANLGTVFGSPDELLNSMDTFTAPTQQQQQQQQVRTNQTTEQGGNPMDDLSFIDSIDLIPPIDMDILTDVEELLSSNRDNIMTWL